MSKDNDINNPTVTTGQTTASEPSSLKLILALGIAGLLSGIILVGTFIYTEPIIRANKEAAMQKAIFKVLPNCTDYTTLILENGKLSEKGEEQDANKKRR